MNKKRLYNALKNPIDWYINTANPGANNKIFILMLNAILLNE